MPFQDVAVVRAIYEAMARREWPTIFGMLHPSFVITQDPVLPWGGWYEGHHGFATFGTTMASFIDWELTALAIFEANGEIVQYGRIKGSVLANGATFDVPEVHRWTVKEGRAELAHFSVDVPAMLRALNS